MKELGAGVNKPGMLVMHKSWCGVCKALGPQFANSNEIQNLANNFVMINVQDDDDPNDAAYQIDGAYIPRIYFLDSQGKPMAQYTSGNPNYRYFYSSPSEIAAAMRHVLQDWTDKDL